MCARIVLESHIDDFLVVSRLAEVELLLEQQSILLRWKVSDFNPDVAPIEPARVSVFHFYIETLLYEFTDRPDLKLEVHELASFLS